MDEYLKDLEKAIQIGRKRDYKEAISILTGIVCNTDNYPIAFLYLGRSYHAIGEYEKAINIFEYYLKIKPDSCQGQFFLGRTYLAIGLYKKAVFRLKKVIQLNPDLYIAYSFIGLAYLKLRNPDLSLLYFEEALKLAPENRNIYNGYLNALLIKAIKLFYRNHFQEAKQMFEFITNNRSDSLLPYLYLARINRELGNYKKSLENYEKACQLSPDDSVLKLQKALLLLKLGQREQAFKELKKNSLLINSPSIKTLTPIVLLKFSALTYFQQKEYKKAIYFGNKVLKDNYQDAEMHAVIAESYHLIGELDKAMNHYLRCLEIHYSPEIHYTILQILWQSHDYKQLFNHVKRMLKKNPEDKIAEYFLALVIVHTDAEPEKIIQTLQNQIKSSGPDPRLMSTLGQVYFKYNFPELAENWLTRTLKIIDNDHAVLTTLIKIYKVLNNPVKLLKTYNQYFKYYSDDLKMKKEYIRFLIHEKKYKKAIKELNCIIPYEVNNIGLKKTLSICYIKSGKYDDAIVILKTLLKEKPDSLDFLQTFIYCLDMTDRRKTAIDILENAKQYFKNHISILSSLGILYLKEQNLEKALEINRNLLSNYPGDWKIYRNLAIIYQKMGNTLFANKFFKRAQQYKNKIKK